MVSNVYAPLKGQDIRVFSFTSSKQKRGLFSRSRSSSESAIQGRLDYVSLDKPRRLPYAALSYTWGSPFPPGIDSQSSPQRTPDRSIGLNGQGFSVGENLHDAFHILRTLKSPYVDYPLWIDAVCINQKDLAERNAQVAMMGQVYAEAIAVYVWLGPHDCSSRIALNAIQRFEQAMAAKPSYQQINGRYTFSDSDTFFGVLRCAPITSEEWQAISDFFSRTWFHRAWIVQEVALSRTCIFLCGDSMIPKERLKLFVDWICRLEWNHELKSTRRDKGVHLDSGITTLFETLRLRNFVQAELRDANLQTSLSHLLGVSLRTERDLFYTFTANLLFRVQHRQASEARDKVFAPLALARMTTKDQRLANSLPLPDYSSSVERVYTQVTSFIISQLGNPSILSFVHRSRSGTAGLPSWVPDYNSPTTGRSLSELNHNATKSWAAHTRKHTIMLPTSCSMLTCIRSRHQKPSAKTEGDFLRHCR